jgi:hypothetical protein
MFHFTYQHLSDTLSILTCTFEFKQKSLFFAVFFFTNDFLFCEPFIPFNVNGFKYSPMFPKKKECYRFNYYFPVLGNYCPIRSSTEKNLRYLKLQDFYSFFGNKYEIIGRHWKLIFANESCDKMDYPI